MSDMNPISPVSAAVQRRIRSRAARGFSLVELLISVVIGMVALMFALRLVAGSEGTQRTEVASSDSMQNGMMALFSISGDAAQSGFGLNDPIIEGCDTVFSDTGGYMLAQAARGSASVSPLAPVIIESNGQNPDSVSFYSGSSMAGTGSLRVVADYGSGASLTVDRMPYGFARGDVIVVAPENVGSGKCALAQLSSNASQNDPTKTQQVQFATASDLRFNSGSLGVSFSGSASRLFDLGPGAALSFHRWSVANGYLQMSATDVGGAGAKAASVADNIVSIKAQYGFDTRATASFLPGSGMVVGQWSSTMIDADGDGTAGGAGDYGRIAAVRLAVVARSKAADAPGAGGSCRATTAFPTVFASGVGGSAAAAAAPVTVNVAVSGDTRDWRCYRYRVFETIVPLRNAGWRPS